jgi:hypothetical protein
MDVAPDQGGFAGNNQPTVGGACGEQDGSGAMGAAAARRNAQMGALRQDVCHLRSLKDPDAEPMCLAPQALAEIPSD